MLNKFLAMLVVHQHNIHMLHWKSKGVHFGDSHSIMGDIYNSLSEDLDTCVEMAMEYGINPPTLQEALTTLSDDETEHLIMDSSVDYSGTEAVQRAISILQALSNCIDKLVETDELKRCHISDMDSIQSKYMKYGRYLLARRNL